MKQYGLRTITWQWSDNTAVEERLKVQQIIRTPDDVVSMFRPFFAPLTVEKFVTLWLNAANGVIGYEEVSSGVANSTMIHPREVFRSAIVSGACAVILMHNHPSGNREPSSDDRETTRQMLETGKVVGIPVHDHIVFGGDGYTSFAEAGLL